ETLAVTIKKAFNTVIAPWFLSCNHLRNGFKSQSAYSMMETSTSSTNPWRNVRDNARTSLSRLGTTKGLLGLGIYASGDLFFSNQARQPGFHMLGAFCMFQFPFSGAEMTF
ncbi:hypothetical protein PgNI_05525, partial [Pyricularia grisea]|uniref:Uncharacterized protein n=1 Tax=Pyricularia grisea TaxID=148305 RepID=A0A6P8B683_PYRGI